LMTAEETLEMKRALIDEEFDRMDLHKFEGEKEEVEEIKDIFCKEITHLNDIFRYYSGYGHGDNASAVGGNTAAMSLMEFEHFVMQCEVWRGGLSHHQIFTQVFKDANKEFSSNAMEDQDNPDGQLLRFEFFECLIRLAKSGGRIYRRLMR